MKKPNLLDKIKLKLFSWKMNLVLRLNREDMSKFKFFKETDEKYKQLEKEYLKQIKEHQAILKTLDRLKPDLTDEQLTEYYDKLSKKIQLEVGQYGLSDSLVQKHINLWLQEKMNIKTQKQVKIQKTQKFNEYLVCIGKLSCGDVSGFSKLMDIEELRDKLRPVLISETEEIVAGDYTYLADDKELSFKPVSEEHLEAANELSLKVLALPENFSFKHLQFIAEGKLKDGDEVYVVCENICIQTGIRCGYPCNGDCNKTGYQFTKLTDNHITLFPVK